MGEAVWREWRAEDIREHSVLSAQFFCELRIALKNSLFKKTDKTWKRGNILQILSFFFFSFWYFQGHASGIWKFPG